MKIETIAFTEYDTEICVSCPHCGETYYEDPRPDRACGFLNDGLPDKCPACGEMSEVTGATVWAPMLRGLSRSLEVPREFAGQLPDGELDSIVRCVEYDFAVIWNDGTRIRAFRCDDYSEVDRVVFRDGSVREF